ncbi:MAG: NERD domain-containing protein [Planctomycetes bacterium]|nr:NERD domain-containing protein [Planctomycetota bacterium]
MARMIPAVFDETTRSYAERDLYYRLQNHLDEDWTVIHSLPWFDDAPYGIRDRECDFLLLHPRYGLLALETKSGAPRYNGKDEKWLYDDGTKVADPFKQAREAMYNLTRRLGKSTEWKNAKLPFGYAVAFPDARSVLGALRPDLDIGLFILEPDLEQLEQKLIRVLARFSEPPARSNRAAVEEALEILRPSFHLVPALPTLSTTIEFAKSELVRLTAEQVFAMEGMAGNSRLLVRGGAGTGKTLLIVAEATRLAEEGKNVLVLCFNRPLSAFLRQQFPETADGVTAATFHEFCQAILKDTATPPPVNSGPA